MRVHRHDWGPWIVAPKKTLVRDCNACNLQQVRPRPTKSERRAMATSTSTMTVKVVNPNGTPYEGPEYSWPEDKDYHERIEESLE